MISQIQIPFYTGVSLNVQQLIHHGYTRFYELFGTDLDLPGWTFHPTVETTPGQGSRLVFDASNREGDPIIPRWVGVFDSATLTGDRVVAGRPVDVRRVDILLFDFGVGVLRATVDFPDRELSARQRIAEVELASNDLADWLADAIVEFRKEFCSVMRSGSNEFLVTGLAAGETNARTFAIKEEKAGLWVHRIVPISLYEQPREKLYAQLATLGSLEVEHAVELTDSSDGYTVVPGTGTSVVLYPEGEDIPPAVHQTLALLNAYWAASAKYDEAVFAGISDLHIVGRTGAIKSIRPRAEEVLQLQERVLIFRAIVDHQGHHLSPDGQRVWGAISRTWNLEPLFEGMQSNVGALDQLFRHVSEEVRSEQADRLNRIVFLLTIASVATVGIDVFSFLSSSPASAPLGSRVSITLAPVLALIAAWMIVRRQRS